MNRAVAVVVALLAAVLVAASLMVPAGASVTTFRTPPPAAREREGLRMLTQNVEDGRRAVDAALERARRTDADLVFLQEVCATDIARIRRAHPRWSVHLLRDHGRGCESGPAGSAVIARHRTGLRPVGLTFASQSSVGGVRSRNGVACLAAPDLLACSTHVYAFDRATGRRQLGELTRWLAARTTSGRLVALGGDLNREPGSADLDQLYAPTSGVRGRGDFVEVSRRDGRACRCGLATHNTPGCLREASRAPHKIDYLFVDRGHLDPTATTAVRAFGCAGSDHRLLYARI